MKLLVLVNVFEPDLGGGVLFSDLCYGLAERGIDVTVRCAYPYYPEWRDKSGWNGLRIRHEVKRGVRIERFGLYIPRNPHSLAQRLLYEASFFASLMRRVPRRGAFDAILVFCPLMGAVACAAVFRRWCGLPVWLNVQDLSADAAVAGGIGRGRWMHRIQSALFNQADVWSTISPGMVERLRPQRRRDQPLLYVPNWVHESLEARLRALPTRERYTPSPPMRLFYSGNLGTKQNLLAWCRILHQTGTDFSFVIQAEGSRVAELRNWHESVGDRRFELRGLSDEARLAQSLREADFVVITERPNTGRSFIPSKLIPATLGGIPVMAVCDVDSPLGREMIQHGLGPHATWQDADTLCALLEGVEPARYDEWCRNALKRSASCPRERILEDYVRELEELRHMEP